MTAIRPSIIADAEFIAGHLWERGDRELSAYGVTWLSFMNLHEQAIDAGMSITITRDGEPIGLLAIAKDGTSHFIATNKFDAAATKALAQAIPVEAEKRGIQKIAVFSLAIDRRAPRWFALLGLEDDGPTGREFGGFPERLYKYERGRKCAAVAEVRQ
jgi:hypothetical protein